MQGGHRVANDSCLHSGSVYITSPSLGSKHPGYSTVSHTRFTVSSPERKKTKPQRAFSLGGPGGWPVWGMAVAIPAQGDSKGTPRHG